MIDQDQTVAPESELAAPVDRRGGGRRRKRRVGVSVLTTVGVLFFAGFAIFPLAFLVSGSFKTLAETYSGLATLIPADPTFENFRYVLLENTLDQTSYPINAANSLVIAAMTIALTMAISLPAALVVARQRYWLTTLLSGWVRVAQVVGGIVVIIPVYLILRELQLVNTLIGVSLAETIPTSAFSIWILVRYIRQIPVELEEAAGIDGASNWRVLWHIIIPLARPGILSVVLVVFLLSWNDFLNPLILLDDPYNYTVMISLYTYIGQVGQIEWGRLLALGVLGALPPLLLIIFAERHIVRGLLSGSLK